MIIFSTMRIHLRLIQLSHLSFQLLHIIVGVRVEMDGDVIAWELLVFKVTHVIERLLKFFGFKLFIAIIVFQLRSVFT